ncbi:MAG: hypothetical protein H7274_25700 [Rhodoferax sp.]|nr:hypothetical protein [Rhodoferax sp.]
MAGLNGLFLPYKNSGHPLFGTCGLPNDIRKLLSDALIDVIRNDKTIRRRMVVIGVEPLGEPSAKAEAFFDQELVRWKDVIDRAGIKLDK